MPRKAVIFLDADDTLIRSVDSIIIPVEESGAFVKRAMDSGGDCFVDFLPKSDLILDERGDKIYDYGEMDLQTNTAKQFNSQVLLGPMRLLQFWAGNCSDLFSPRR